jgi:hypothetical protein
MEKSMKRWLIAALLLLTSFCAAACPLCLAFVLNITARDLVDAERSVLALPEDGGKRFRVVEVIRGEPPARGVIEADAIFKLDASSFATSKPLLLLRQEKWARWVNFGTIHVSRADWLRRLAAGKRSSDMTDADWQVELASLLPYLEDSEPLVADIAYGELASAPYSALRTLKPRLDASTLRRWVDDPQLAKRQSLYTLLLGIAGDESDAVRYEHRIEAAWKAKDATNVGPMLAADLELRGVSRMTWIDARYIRDRNRTTPELEAALLALSVQGNASGAIPRERVIQSYRDFMKEHKPLAGFVAADLAAWKYWGAVPEYRALMKSDLPQHMASRIAIVSYLQQSPGGDVWALK